MENLIIKETKYTPEVKFNANEGILNIKGNSYPENTLEFYDPILNLMENFFSKTKNKNIILNTQLSHIKNHKFFIYERLIKPINRHILL